MRLTGSCCRTVFVMVIPSAPPAQAPPIPRDSWVICSLRTTHVSESVTTHVNKDDYPLFIIRGDIWRVKQQYVDFSGQAGKKRVDQITSYRIQDCLNTDRYQSIEFATVNGWMNVICSSGFSGCSTCVRIYVGRYDNYVLRSIVVSL